MSWRWVAVSLIALLVAGTAPAAQKKSKQKGQSKEPAAAETQLRLPDAQQIDQEISEMLGAWQVGDTNMMHNYYADDLTVVSGAFEPPLVGWQAYLAAYQRERQHLSSLRLDRRNTFIFPKGTFAYAVYQWEFVGLVDGNPTRGRGHTTLVFEKRGDRWLIVHNHTSAVCESIAQQPVAPKPGS